MSLKFQVFEEKKKRPTKNVKIFIVFLYGFQKKKKSLFTDLSYLFGILFP